MDILVNRGNDAPLSTGGSGMLGGLAGGLIGAATTAWQNKQNRAEAALNRKWQETQATTAWQRSQQAASTQWDRQMYAANTSHQRQVADLKAAGLNPILAAGGKGAVSPSAGMATAPTGSGAQARNEKMDVLAGMVSAAQLKNLKETNNLIRQQAEVQKATANKLKADTAFTENKVDITTIPAKALSNADNMWEYIKSEADELNKGTKWLMDDMFKQVKDATDGFGAVVKNKLIKAAPKHVIQNWKNIGWIK